MDIFDVIAARLTRGARAEELLRRVFEWREDALDCDRCVFGPDLPHRPGEREWEDVRRFLEEGDNE